MSEPEQRSWRFTDERAHWKLTLEALRVLVDSIGRKEVAAYAGTKRQNLDDALSETAGKSPRFRWVHTALKMANEPGRPVAVRDAAMRLAAMVVDLLDCEPKERPRLTGDERARRYAEGIAKEFGDCEAARRVHAYVEGRLR